jgi:hypothetical protein
MFLRNVENFSTTTWRQTAEETQKVADMYEGVSKSFRTGRLERELQMV